MGSEAGSEGSDRGKKAEEENSMSKEDAKGVVDALEGALDDLYWIVWVPMIKHREEWEEDDYAIVMGHIDGLKSLAKKLSSRWGLGVKTS